MTTDPVEEPDAVPRDPLRPPDTVARLRRMGCLHQTRLSFVRALTRRMAREGWRIERDVFDIGADEVGHARYAVHTPQGRYSFVVFADRIDPQARTDRVIAEEWDYTFALVEGVPDDADMARLRANVPKQEAGRMCARDLVLSRGNKSARLFDHVVDALARGRQPALAQIAKVGYLMRTTAVYGNGKFGLADFDKLRRQGAFPQPFSAQMLTVFLAREFSLDLVEALARTRDPQRATRLLPALRRTLAAEDPAMAARLNPDDQQRQARALEVVRATGRSLDAWQREAVPASRDYDVLTLAALPPRRPLYAKIDRRLAQMVEQGALDEVQELLDQDLDPRIPAMKAVGVPQLAGYLRGEVAFADALARAQRATRQYAKRQLTWLRHQTPRDAGKAAFVYAQFSESAMPLLFNEIREFMLTAQA